MASKHLLGMTRSFAVLSTAAVSLFTSAAAFAQVNLLPDTIPKARFIASEQKVIGWANTAKLGLNLAFSSSENVIGQVDGQSQTYGLNLKASFNDVRENSEWRNTVSYNGATSKTPGLERYAKSADEAKVETIYLYAIPSAPAFGPYVKGAAATSFFKGEDLRATPSVYNISNANGTTSQRTDTTFRLTDAFHPMTVQESVGGFWKAVDEDKLKVETRLGFGAEQISATGQYAITGSAADGSLSVKELRDVSQAGLEAAVTAIGKIDDKSGYEASLQTLTPFINDKPSGDDRSAIRLTNVEGRVKLTSNITSWAAFAYDYRLMIQPQLVDKTQQAHMLVLNVNYNIL